MLAERKVMPESISAVAIAAARKLSKGVDALPFAEPTTHIYNPLDYAWAGHRSYLQQHANSKKKVVFHGNEPGPLWHGANRRALW